MGLLTTPTVKKFEFQNPRWRLRNEPKVEQIAKKLYDFICQQSSAISHYVELYIA